ncbi:MAG: cytoplasmic protein [Rhizobiaceae bacterium]|nr:cytoplasmic protein [Rhizobiaceae bacterium]
MAVYRLRKSAEATEARQAAALQLACGVDLKAALNAVGAERSRLRLRIARRLERERMRGLARHWSYDLNRHIALKQALDRLS